MKTLIISVLTVAFSTIGMAQSVYYVSLTGDDGNSGLTPLNSWRTITYAVSSSSPVSPGDTVFVKAGDYGNENVVFETDGTSESPIVFEGYQFISGDNPDLEWEYGDSLNADIMPMLDGGDRTTGTGIFLHSREYINLNNFQIRNYQIGLFAWNANNLTIDNIITMYFGDINEDYDGKGIVLVSLAGNNIIKNCVVYNACAEGLSIYGNNHYVKNCRVYSDDDSTGIKSAMDYYIHVGGSNNIIENCYVERVGDLGSYGHGIGLKGDCENNIILNCVAKGLRVYGFNVRHRGARNNIFENCIAIECGYAIRDGASNNTFKNCTAIDAERAVIFFDSSEDEGAQYAGRNNVFENCIFQNTQESVIDFFYYSEATIADSNSFVNCLFDGGNYLFNSDRENRNNKMVNCIVTNVNNYFQAQRYPDSTYPLNFDFEYTNFWNNGFDAPQGVNITVLDPDFVDLPNSDYHLKSTSGCIDIGTLSGAPIADFDGISRPQGNGIDIGPYEYVAPLSVDNVSLANQLLIYPNPAASQITITGVEPALINI